MTSNANNQVPSADDHEPGPETPRDEIAALLAFYVTGGLEGADEARVERWLTDHPDDAGAALANLEDERGATVLANEAIAPPPGALARLKADIAAEPARTPRAASLFGPAGLLRQGLQRLNELPRSLAWGACGVLLALTIAQGIWLNAGSGRDPFSLATGERDLAGPMALVAFSSNATMQSIADALEEVGATIVSGPRGGGLFEVRFPDDEDLGSAAERMKKLGERRRVVRLLKPIGMDAP